MIIGALKVIAIVIGAVIGIVVAIVIIIMVIIVILGILGSIANCHWRIVRRNNINAAIKLTKIQWAFKNLLASVKEKTKEDILDQTNYVQYDPKIKLTTIGGTVESIQETSLETAEVLRLRNISHNLGLPWENKLLWTVKITFPLPTGPKTLSVLVDLGYTPYWLTTEGYDGRDTRFSKEELRTQQIEFKEGDVVELVMIHPVLHRPYSPWEFPLKYEKFEALHDIPFVFYPVHSGSMYAPRDNVIRKLPT